MQLSWIIGWSAPRAAKRITQIRIWTWRWETHSKSLGYTSAGVNNCGDQRRGRQGWSWDLVTFSGIKEFLKVQVKPSQLRLLRVRTPNKQIQ